jgi:hypothetical protein
MQYFGIILIAVAILIFIYSILELRRSRILEREDLEDGDLSENARNVIGEVVEKPFDLVTFRGETIKMGIYEAWYFNNVLKDRKARSKAWALAKKGKYPFPEILEMEKDWRATKDNPIEVTLP